MKYDYLIIGAGISGISSALLLARFGFQVALVEQAPQPAPLIAGFVRDKVYYDAGFHYAGGLEEGGALDLHLRLLGVSEHLQKVPLATAAYDTVVVAQRGLNFSFPQGYAALRATLQERFPKQSQALDGYLSRVQETTRKLPYYHEQAPVRKLLREQSLSQVLDEFSITGDLRIILQVHCLLHGVSPAEIPFAIHAGVVDGYYASAQTFKGGGRALAAALAAALKRSGVDLFCRHRVEEIELSAAGALAGVRCANGVRLQASGCLATLHPQALLRLLPTGVFRPAYRHRLAALQESPSAEIVFLRRERQRGSTLGVRCERQQEGAGSESGIPLHDFWGRNFFFLPGPGKSMFDFTLPSSERLLYLNFSGLGGVYGGDGEGASGMTALLPAPSSKSAEQVVSAAAYRAEKQRTGELVRQRIAAQLPELASGLTVECVATGGTLRRINASPWGSLYGVKQMVGQFNPSPRTRLAGLLLAGQATAAPGLLGAITSALLAVGEIVGHERLAAMRGEHR